MEPIILFPKNARVPTVVVADDDSSSLLLLVILLNRLGIETLSASNGADAIRLFMAHSEIVDAVVLDLHMPLLNGAAAMERIRKIAPNLPVVITSATSQKAIENQYTPIQPWRYLAKPYNLDCVRRLFTVNAGSTDGQRCAPAVNMAR